MAGKGMSNGARHSRQVSPRAKVLLVGLGYAGVKVVRTAARQFEHPDYAFLAVDQSPELQAQCELPVLVTAAGWEQQLPELLDQRNMLLLVVGLGGKTGTRAAKAICGAVRAHRPELPVLIMASMPFAFENGERRALAETSLRELRPFASAIIPLDNELLFAQMPPETNSMAAFERADEWLAEVAVSILRPFACANLVNVKFEHLDWLLKERNAQCAIGIGWGEGENAIGDAIAQVMESPFLQRMASSAQADRALAVVTFPEESTLDQVRGCLTTVRSLFADQLSLEMGACVDASVSEGVRIVVLIHFPPAAPTAKGAAARSRHGSDRQMMLSFTSSITQSRTGIFSASSPTRYQYHNLDIPTYIRQNIDLDTTT